MQINRWVLVAKEVCFVSPDTVLKSLVLKEWISTKVSSKTYNRNKGRKQQKLVLKR